MSIPRKVRNNVFNRSLVFLLISFIIYAAGPVTAGIDSTIKALDTYFSAALDQWEVPGMAVAIVKDGEVLLARGYGVKHVKKGGRVDEHTLFAIASNTKAFTAAAIAILVEEGKLDWDDRVIDHLPYFQLYDPYVTNDIRIRDLLCHRSGLGTFSGDLIWYGTDYTREEIIRRLRFLKPALPFRSGYGYSNVMFITAGEVIAAVSGMKYETFIRQRFFEPLGMSRTVFSTKKLDVLSNIASPHKVQTVLDWYNWDSMAAAGGIISSVSDMTAWLQLQLQRGTYRDSVIYSEKSGNIMWTPHITRSVSARSRKVFPTKHFNTYGLGWNLMDYHGRMVVSHGGGYDGMYSVLGLVPEENLGLVILTNSMTSITSALFYMILDSFCSTQTKDWSALYHVSAERNAKKKREKKAAFEDSRIKGTKPSLDLEKYTGTFGGDFYGEGKVTIENGQLVVQLLPNPDLTADLEHWHHDVFRLKWRRTFAWFEGGTAQFILDKESKVIEMKLDVPNDDLWFHELEFLKKE